MFMHRNRGRHAQAVSLGLLAAALISTAAAAADAPDAFVLVAYSNRAGGAPISQGDYAVAAQVAHEHVSLQSDPGATATNRCVAFAMSEQLSQAQHACDAAIQEARISDTQVLSWTDHGHDQERNAEAVAYSNRAVLRWLNSDAKGAAEDLAKAESIAPHASFVVRNVSAMHSHENVSTVSTAALVKAAQE
jgi:hypothetical protein